MGAQSQAGVGIGVKLQSHNLTTLLTTFDVLETLLVSHGHMVTRRREEASGESGLGGCFGWDLDNVGGCCGCQSRVCEPL